MKVYELIQSFRFIIDECSHCLPGLYASVLLKTRHYNTQTPRLFTNRSVYNTFDITYTIHPNSVWTIKLRKSDVERSLRDNTR